MTTDAPFIPQTYATPKERFLAEARESLRGHEREARRLRKLIQNVEHPPVGVELEFSVGGGGVRFIKRIEPGVFSGCRPARQT